MDVLIDKRLGCQLVMTVIFEYTDINKTEFECHII